MPCVPRQSEFQHQYLEAFSREKTRCVFIIGASHFSVTDRSHANVPKKAGMTGRCLETVDADHLLVETKAGVLLVVGDFTTEEVVHVVALIALELNHLAVLLIFDDGAIAVVPLLGLLADLLEVPLLGNVRNSGQGLASIALCTVIASAGRIRLVRNGMVWAWAIYPSRKGRTLDTNLDLLSSLGRFLVVVATVFVDLGKGV